ncbi:MAG TPA: hypothetical protein DEW22_02270 [Clostridiales bacterium]|nr:hypothetical protein [Clostridiales bacterium]
MGLSHKLISKRMAQPFAVGSVKLRVKKNKRKDIITNGIHSSAATRDQDGMGWGGVRLQIYPIIQQPVWRELVSRRFFNRAVCPGGSKP